MKAHRIALAVMVAMLLAPATARAEETRTFDGRGSVGTSSPVELYLLAGTYRHGIEADAGCALTAGVFPAHREPAVLVRDVLQADLAVDMGDRAGPSGEFVITQPGWATVQVGTGPACAWQYTVTGDFLPLGREPGPPGALTQPWILWVAIAAGIVVMTWRLRRTDPTPEPDEPPKVTVIDV